MENGRISRLTPARALHTSGSDSMEFKPDNIVRFDESATVQEFFKKVAEFQKSPSRGTKERSGLGGGNWLGIFPKMLVVEDLY